MEMTLTERYGRDYKYSYDGVLLLEIHFHSNDNEFDRSKRANEWMFYGMKREKNSGFDETENIVLSAGLLLLRTLIKIDVRPFHFDQIEKSIHLFVWSEIKSQTKFLLMKWKPFICLWKEWRRCCLLSWRVLFCLQITLSQLESIGI